MVIYEDTSFPDKCVSFRSMNIIKHVVQSWIKQLEQIRICFRNGSPGSASFARHITLDKEKDITLLPLEIYEFTQSIMYHFA